nr:rna exonuclease 4 [Quercus suber]
MLDLQWQRWISIGFRIFIKGEEHRSELILEFYNSIGPPFCAWFVFLFPIVAAALEPVLAVFSTPRHKCSACFKQYNKKEHLVEHMKHCKSFESLREHVIGPLPKEDCSRVFSEQGCNLCLKVFDSPISLSEHKRSCRLLAPSPIRSWSNCLRCEMVGGGDDGTLDLCALVCLIDEDVNVIFHTYEITGLTEEHLRDAMPLKLFQEIFLQILYNGESIVRARMQGGKARLLVGHALEHDLDCLRMNYLDNLLRDTAKYPPLTKTNLVQYPDKLS